MTKKQLNQKTRKELAALISIGHMNKFQKDRKYGKYVMRAYLNGMGAMKPAKKEEMINMVLHLSDQGFIR